MNIVPFYFGLLLVLLRHVADGRVDPEFEKITLGSVIKLTNSLHPFHLHSHEVRYAGGSQQQSVTGFPEDADSNSYFVVRNAFADGKRMESYSRNEAIACGQLLRLEHLTTKKFLHSHPHGSPLSRNQEVSAYGEADKLESDQGDNWVLECVDLHQRVWKREQQVRLRHSLTGLYLFIDDHSRFGHPIHGQAEVCAVKSSAFRGGNRGEQWIVEYGVFFSTAQ